VIASTCHRAQPLHCARVARGRNVGGYYRIEDDVNNAGAEFANAPSVIDRNRVSSPHYQWMGEWMKTAIDLVKS